MPAIDKENYANIQYVSEYAVDIEVNMKHQEDWALADPFYMVRQKTIEESERAELVNKIFAICR